MIIIIPLIILLSSIISLFVKFAFFRLIPATTFNTSFRPLLQVMFVEIIIIHCSLLLFMVMTIGLKFDLRIINYLSAISPDRAFLALQKIIIEHKRYLLVIMKSFFFVFIMFFINSIPTLKFLSRSDDILTTNKKHRLKFIQAGCLGIIAPVIFCISINIILIKTYESREASSKNTIVTDNFKKFEIMLFKTVQAGYPRLVDLVISKGVDINNVNIDTNKATALHWAVKDSDNLDVVKYLLDKGADINHKKGDGFTALIKACGYKKSSPEMIQLLINHGADINEQTNYGLTALIVASARTKGRPPIYGVWGTEIEKKLIENGADVNIQSKSGKTALMAAVKANNIEVAKLLLNNGAEVNIRDKDGKTAYMLGQTGQMNNLLINHGAKEY